MKQYLIIIKYPDKDAGCLGFRKNADGNRPQAQLLKEHRQLNLIVDVPDDQDAPILVFLDPDLKDHGPILLAETVPMAPVPVLIQERFVLIFKTQGLQHAFCFGVDVEMCQNNLYEMNLFYFYTLFLYISRTFESCPSVKGKL